MPKIDIRCPDCRKKGYIEIDEDIINNSSRGVAAINIAKEQICSHAFIVYIDKNFIVRDCFLADFQIELPEITVEGEKEEGSISQLGEIDADIIKMNISPLSLTLMIRACLLNYDLVIISPQKYLNSHIRKLLNFIFKDSFTINFAIETKERYKKKKKQYKNFLKIEEDKVKNDKKNQMDKKKIKIERKIVQKFYAEEDPTTSLIIMKNDIKKLKSLSEKVREIMDTYRGKEKLGKKRVIDKLAEVEQSQEKISFSYLELLLDILKLNYDYDLSVLSDYYFPAFGI
ncbi:MAG: hypothetical protein ACOC44_20280 [Promethearchaeia archaeon]